MAYGMADVIQRGRMIDEGGAADEVKRVERAKLNALLAICETPGAGVRRSSSISAKATRAAVETATPA